LRAPLGLGGGLNKAARCGVRGWPGCAGSRGAHRDGEATTGAPRFGLSSSAKGGKREDDDDDVGVTQSGPHLVVTPGGAR
jgi:hypothetical protein